jgi:methyl-accepting chemotaxis protein
LAATAEEMTTQAEQLQQTMSFFKNSNSDETAEPPVQRAVRQPPAQPPSKSRAVPKAPRKFQPAMASVAGNLALAGEPNEAEFAKFP